MSELLYLNVEKKITDDLLNQIEVMIEKSNIDTHSNVIFYNKYGHEYYNGEDIKFEYVGKCEHWEGENYTLFSMSIPFSYAIVKRKDHFYENNKVGRYEDHLTHLKTIRTICKLLLDNGYKVRVGNNNDPNPDPVEKYSTLKWSDLDETAIISFAELCELLP